MDIEIKLIPIPSVDRVELGQVFEATEPYTGCGCIHYYFDRSTNTSASECNGRVEYGLGMEKLPKWQHPLLLLAIEVNKSWNEVYSAFFQIEAETATRVIAERKSFQELVDMTKKLY